jgi:hypothetical protein
MAHAAAMQDADIFVKTDAGRDEIKSRALGLPMSIRAILLMIDGRRSVASMRSIIAGSKAPPDVLDSLFAQGLIEPVVAPAPVVAPVVVEAPTPAPAPAPTLRALPVPASPSRSSYDGPLDLTLPTIGPTATTVAPNETAAPPSTVEAPTTGANDAAAPAVLNRYEHLYGMMNDIVRDFLSPTRRYFFQLKIERCGTPEELLELLYDLQTALAKSRGEAFASEVISRLRSAAA